MLKILDLSHRLPGPYAAKRLAHLGFSVTRVEDIHHADPFLDQQLEKINPQFSSWHKKLSAEKKIVQLDLSHPDELTKLKELVLSHNVIINSRGERFLNTIGVDENFCQSNKLLAINLKASKHEPHLHDLNALAQSSLLNYHLIHFKNKNIAQNSPCYFPPPFLPIAGLAFGHGITENILAHSIKNEFGIKHIYLDDEVKNSIAHLQFNDALALHNGKFPSYGIYRLKSEKSFVAIALIEEKFWHQFITETNLLLTLDDRFSTDEKVFKTMADFFSIHDQKSLDKLFSKKLSCITVFEI